MRRNSSELCHQNQPLFDALNPGLHDGVSIVGQTNGNAKRDTHARLGAHDVRSARSDALHGGRCEAHARRSKAGTWRNSGAVESGPFFVKKCDGESSQTFRSLEKEFSHDADSPSGASLRVDFEVAGPSRDAEGNPQFQQPSAQKSFSLDIGTTVCRLGRSAARKGDDFSRFNHFLAFDHHRLVTHRSNVGKSGSRGIGRQSLPFPTIHRKKRR